MATVYIAPTAEGSANGSSPENAYGFSSLTTAESDAGNGGTILFTDGSYTIANTTFSGSNNNITYKSLNKHGATLTSSSPTTLTLGPFEGSDITLQDFKVRGAISYSARLKPILIGIDHQDTIAHTGTLFNTLANYWRISDSIFVVNYSGNAQLFFNDTTGTTEINRCSFFIKCSSVGSGGISGGTTGSQVNTIYSSDNSNAINDNVINTSNLTNCCIHNMHSNDSSGGTNNIFADPQYVDPANGDLRLRPNSPCISAGTND